jgi:hypothetical protein
MKLPMIIIKLLIFGALFIVSNHDLALVDNNDRDIFYEKYSLWIGDMFNQGVDITGYVVKSEWLPEVNSSFSAELERIIN